MYFCNLVRIEKYDWLYHERNRLRRAHMYVVRYMLILLPFTVYSLLNGYYDQCYLFVVSTVEKLPSTTRSRR